MSRADGSHLTEGRLIDLEAGLLDEAARAETLAHLRSCAGCEARLREAHGDAERLTLRPPPRQAPAGAARTRHRLVWGAVAATVVLAIALSTLLRRAPADGLDYWLPAEADLLLTRSGAPLEDDAPFREAVAAYDRREVRKVIALLDEREIPPEYAPLNLLLASALEWEGHHARARAVLERFDVDTLPQPARDQARFILFAALTREGRAEEARQVAVELARGTGDLADRARAALDQSGRPTRTKPAQ